MDYAHEWTDGQIDDDERKLARIYKKYGREAKAKVEKWLKQFETEDARMREKLAAGEITEREYKAWKQLIITNADDFREMCKGAAASYLAADIKAAEVITASMLETFALNHNWEVFKLETVTNGRVKGSLRTGLSFDIYDAKAAKASMDKTLVPKVDKVRQSEWLTEKVAQTINAGVVTGDSVPSMAKRLSDVTQMDYRQAVRTVRTAHTSAQNAGRQQSYVEAKAKGIECVKQWLATSDDRTRPDHLDADGQIVEIGSTFIVGGEELEYPGEPEGSPEQTYNCRCTMVCIVEGSDEYSELFTAENFEDWLDR